jgi:hypothetical protein
MKKKLFFAAVAIVALASCSDNEFIGDNSPTTQQENAADEIQFGLNVQNTTRAGELIGATAAEKLGGMFVVEGTKGSEETSSPSTTVVFDNYLVGYKYNSAGKTEDNTNNWEYVGLESGITSRMKGETWTALHPSGSARVQSIKYWDYSVPQYDFIAWSTGTCEAVTDAAAAGKVKVTRINTGSTLSTNGFTMSPYNAADLLQCYYTDINTVLKANYKEPVTLTFKSLAAKVRIALYETVPGYSVKAVKFYSADANPTAPTDLGTGSSAENAVLFTMGSDALPQRGDILVCYPHIGTSNNAKDDYKKASVTVTVGSGEGATATTQTFGALTAQYTGKESYEADENIYLGRTLPNATFAGASKDNFYTAVFPNTNGKPLTLRVDYTLVATDGSGETINIYGAKAVVPATYTVWQPNYAYTYIFKISDNTNGWTSQTGGGPDGDPGLFPITFDAVVTSFTDANAEQTTVTTVATPSITTYQQGHTKANNEYSKSQTAGKPATQKDVYVQVMDNSYSGSPTPTTPTLKTDLKTTNKSLLFAVSKANASEAEVMDALQNRTNLYSDASPVGRNGITLTTNPNISNTETSIVNGVDDQPITVAAGTAAKIDIDQLAAGTYAYVYATTVPSAEEKIYQVASISGSTADEKNTDAQKYYEIALTGTETPLASGTAAAGNVYFVKNVDANGDFVSYTFKQTKVGDDVTGLVEATILANKANTYTEGHFYFDVYNQNNGAYAVKVIKVVD